MARLPFNPKRMQGVAAGETSKPTGPAPLSVSQLATLIDRAIRDHTPTGLRVVGEIGQFRERSHWYFDLKDSLAVVSCVMWQSAARKVGFTPRTGQQVLVSGSAEFYPAQGRTQFMVTRIEPIGAGALDLALRQLIEEVRALGWLDEHRKRPLPLVPRKVAVVTSATGAALQDVLDTARRRCPSMPMALVDVRVQGEGAAAQIAQAIRRLSLHHDALGVDVILVTRGGGSMEDLWAFNERAVAQAIVESHIPVVAAIGHETDTTLAELVADVRAATPSQAAMRAVPDAAALDDQLRSLAARATSLIQRQLRALTEHVRSTRRHARLAMRDNLRSRELAVDRLAARLERCRPAALYTERTVRLKFMAERLTRAMHERLTTTGIDATAARLRSAALRALHDCHVATEAAARNLDLVGPPSVIKRGYSVTLGPDGSLLRSVNDAAPGDHILTRLADGSLTSTVQSRGDSRAYDPSIAPAGRRVPVRPRPHTRTRPRPDSDQPNLFG